MEKKILFWLLLCSIFFSVMGSNIIAQSQGDFEAVAQLVNGILLKGDGDLGPWRYTSSTVITRVEVPAVISGDHIYVISGHGEESADPYSTVERAQILSDGTLGNWVLEPETLLVPVYGAAAISKNAYIYLVSGDAHYAQPTPIVQYAQVNPDGSLQPWQQTSPLQQARVNFAFAEYQSYIYVMGGNFPKGLNSVEYAKINPDGTLGDWTYTSSSLVGRWQPSAQAYNGHVYLLGGFDEGGAVTATVEYASINPDGSLSEWNYTSSMTVPRAGTPGTAVLNGYLYVIAGHGSYPWGPLNSVERAFMNPDGSLGSWSLLPDTLLSPVAHAGCAQNNGHVYIVGGYYYPDIAYDDVQMTGVYFLIGGDANCDGVINSADVVYLINYLFKGGPPPGCL